MKNLIRFLIQNSFTLVFILLQVLCFYIIYNWNFFQQSTIYRSGNNLSGAVNERRSNLTDYLNLSDANTRLASENADLRNKEISSFIVIDKEFSLINDTLFKKKYRYAPAKVINSTYSRTANFLTLDKGSIHGFKENMGVNNDQGCVGVVTSVSKNYAIVLPIIHPKAQFSVMIKDSYYSGLLKWDGRKHDVAKMNDVSNHAEINIGDTVITRETTIFPQGIPVGRIRSIEEIEGSNFWDIHVELFVDYTKVYQVYAIENLMADEQKELETQVLK